MHQATRLFDDLRRFCERFDVRVVLKEMDVEKAGEFDLAQAFGSIVQWSTATDMARRVYDGLRTAKKRRREDPTRFEQALTRYRLFEQTSSEHAVWMLAQIGHSDAVADYTTFFRADIEAMTIFHRTGKEPPWPEFYAEWKQRVEAGEIRIDPFTPKPFSSFQPRRIEQQEVVQERD